LLEVLPSCASANEELVTYFFLSVCRYRSLKDFWSVLLMEEVRKASKQVKQNRRRKDYLPTYLFLRRCPQKTSNHETFPAFPEASLDWCGVTHGSLFWLQGVPFWLPMGTLSGYKGQHFAAMGPFLAARRLLDARGPFEGDRSWLGWYTWCNTPHQFGEVLEFWKALGNFEQ